MFYIVCTILEQISIYLPLLLGAYCAFSLLKVPFLALETAYVFGALTASYSYSTFLNLPSYSTLVLSCSAALLGGMTVGLITYAVKITTRISFLLASIISMGLFHGINQLVLKGTHISLPTSSTILALFPLIPSYPQLIVLCSIACIIAGIFFYFTRSALGMSCGVYGNNPDFFEHYGISGDFIQLIGIVISSMLAGISGFLSAFMNGFADISIGFGINLLAITALILGRTCIKTKYTAIIPLVGMIIYCFLQQFLLRINFDSRYFTMIQALVILVLLGLVQTFVKGKKYELGL